MTDDQHGEGTPQGGGRWDPLPQGDYDDGATAFVKLPEGGIDALLSGDSPLAAPGHGYVPPQITATPPAHDGTDPAAAGAWGAPAVGTQWPDPSAVPAQDTSGGDRFTYTPGATGQWNFGDANAREPAPGAGHDVTGQWSIPVAGGDLPDESGEYTTSALLEQWGGTPPATLPGGAPAPWATGPGGAGQPWGQQETAPGADPYAQTPGPYDTGAHGTASPDAAEAERYASAADAALGEAHTAAEASSIAATAYEGYADAATAYDTFHGSLEGASAGLPDAAPTDGFADAPADGFADTPRDGFADVPADVPADGFPDASEGAPEHPDGSTSGPQADAPSGPPDEMALDAEGDDGTADSSHPLPDERPAPGPEPVAGSPEADEAATGSLNSPDTPPGDRQDASPDAVDAVDAGDTRDTGDTGDTAPGDGQDASPEAAVPALDAATPHEAPAPPQEEHPLASYVLRVNGVDRPVTDAWIGESLLYVLRERLGLAGAKDGCSQGECGACNVQVDGRLVASCLVPSVTAAGSEVRTVEGLAVDGQTSDVQRALARCGAVQCGFCVPGMAMTVHDLLEGNPAPTELETRQALCGNLCRCSGYRGVLEAVKDVVAEREAHNAADGETGADEARIPHQAGPGAGGVHPSAFDSPGFPSANGPQGPTDPPGRHDQAYGQDGGQA
ncbi:2Fe-2S iron-sulfur cluster-binding protein [Streptomyces griseus]|uniref:2Fe-2S iron-sulfur cluster-binding protein n=1 Tax=Streptomyces griseus TaxID=1911 RepID=UPI000566BD2A|nr:2Fe-2S iron-sulfur cluster-binding protein [Streptomyces griseus]